MSQSSQSSTQTHGQSPILLLFLSMTSIHSGAAIAKSLFAQVTPFGMTSLRLGMGAIVLFALTRPRWRHYTWKEYRLLGLLGLSMGAMNSLLYHAIAYIPIGVAVTLEFVGPLGVALFHSRQRLDMVWVGLAAAGVLLLAPVGGLSLHPLGMLFALMGGAFWAAYIVLAARVGKVFHGSESVALPIAIGAIAVLPFGMSFEGSNLLSPNILALGLLVGILSTALPYSLEMAALRKLPVKVFGVLMSLEPAVASCVALLFLGEKLSLRIVVAIALVCMASAGATLQSNAGRRS
ncbi:MAG: EamA family transporter [Cyanobacteria bacterium J06626_18]